MTAPPLDASLCPLCGRTNQCAVTAGSDPLGCWCMDTPVSPEALARLPADARGMACLCPACAALCTAPFSTLSATLSATQTPQAPQTPGQK